MLFELPGYGKYFETFSLPSFNILELFSQLLIFTMDFGVWIPESFDISNASFQTHGVCSEALNAFKEISLAPL